MKKALLWKLLERFGVQGVQFVLQIILARILDPENYGVLSLMVIFTTLANVFIQNGFNTSLIQNKDVTEEDYSSVFWVTFGVASALYIVFFASAPAIAVFYEMPGIVWPFRVLSIMLFPGALQSVQLAKVSREMDFRKVFISNIGAILVSGVIGIIIAYCGGGIWALVIQTLLNVTIACLVMTVTVSWRPRLICNIKRVKTLFAYGWKLLVSSLLDTLYQDIRSLVIGKKYDSSTLGIYNRGQQFPQFLIVAINGAVQSVMLPAMSSKQDEKTQVKDIMRNSIVLSAYIIFPMMAGLAGISESLVKLLLTDKWLPCVPYLQIACFSFAFWPVHTCNLQAINAVGRSDIFLKLEIIKKVMATVLLAIAVLCFDTPLAIAMTGIFSTIISCFINSSPNKRLIGYSYIEQMKDILPSFATSIMMLGCVLFVGKFVDCNVFMTMVLQMFTGIVVYLILSAIFRLYPFLKLCEYVKCEMKKE